MQAFKAKVKTPPRCKDPPSNEKAHAKKNPKDKKTQEKGFCTRQWIPPSSSLPH
jgi:hypothetical protein